jgi:hypothetical protein
MARYKKATKAFKKATFVKKDKLKLKSPSIIKQKKMKTPLHENKQFFGSAAAPSENNRFAADLFILRSFVACMTNTTAPPDQLVQPSGSVSCSQDDDFLCLGIMDDVAEDDQMTLDAGDVFGDCSAEFGSSVLAVPEISDRDLEPFLRLLSAEKEQEQEEVMFVNFELFA